MTIKITKYVTEFTLRLGPIVTHGSLLAVQGKKPTGFKLVGPNGEDVRQVYVPVTADSPVWTYDLLEKATKVVQTSTNPTPGVGGTKATGNTIVGKENIEAAKQSQLPINVLNLTAHPAVQVNDQLFPSDNNAYVFQPHTDDPADVQWYVMLLGLLTKSDKAFVGVCNLKNHEGLFRVTVWRDRLVIQKQLYPESINPHEKFDTEITVADEVLAKGLSVIDNLTTDFDASVYKDNVAGKVAAMEKAVLDGNVVVAAKLTEAPAPATIDLDAALDAFGEM